MLDASRIHAAVKSRQVPDCQDQLLESGNSALGQFLSFLVNLLRRNKKEKKGKLPTLKCLNIPSCVLFFRLFNSEHFVEFEVVNYPSDFRSGFRLERRSSSVDWNQKKSRDADCQLGEHFSSSFVCYSKKKVIIHRVSKRT